MIMRFYSKIAFFTPKLVKYTLSAHLFLVNELYSISK